MRKVSIVAPAYNEAAGIQKVVEGWHDYLTQQALIEDFEIIICNDGSIDATGEILDNLAQRIPQLKPVHLPHNQGAGKALSTAIQHTTFSWVFLLDTDDQFPIEAITSMFDAAEQHQVKAVLSVRQKKDTWFARFGSWSSGKVCNWIYHCHIQDFNSACKLVEGGLIRSFRLEAKGMNYSTEMTARIIESGAPWVQLAVSHRERSSGQSNLKWFRDARNRLLFVVYLAMRQYLFKRHIL